MTASHKRAWRQTIAVGAAVLTLLSTFGGRMDASAQSIKLPGGIDASQYVAQFDAIKNNFTACISAANGDKKLTKDCSDATKDAMKALIEQIRDDIKKAKGDHDHDENETGPTTPPTVPTEPVKDVPVTPPSGGTTPPPVTGPRYDAKILVIAADGNEPQLGAIKQTLGYMGTPYDVLVSSNETLTADRLATGDYAHYYGVILTNGETGYADSSGNYVSGLSADEWTILQSFEAAFKVRQVTWYTWPNPVYGLNYPAVSRDTTSSPIVGTLTTTGRQVFSYLTTAPITIKNAYAYMATPSDASTVPLITAPGGYALASIYKYPDGRENLAVTFDTNEFLVHSYQVSYGMVNWVTQGKYVGQRRHYLDAQVDDIFYPNDMWNPSDPANMVGTYRLSGDDLRKTDAWQTRWQQNPIAKDLRLTMVYNGEGTSGDEEYQPDTLTPVVKQLQGKFKWINHTWTHMNLNTVDYPSAYEEFKLNADLANTLKLTNYSVKNAVTPEISGLFNPAAMAAMEDLGVRYVVSDTSRVAEFGNPAPNSGMYNASEPSILMIPRRPSNLFYNVSTPAEWASEYNHIHGAYWGRNLSYTEILDKESDVLLQYVLRGEIYPWMFHQANIRFYDGSRSLLTDLIDVTLNKYRTIFRSPVLSLRQDAIGQRIQERMSFDAAGVTAVFNQNSNTMSITAVKQTVVPVTGVRQGNAVQQYDGQYTSYITVPAGQTVTISLN